MQKRGFVRRVDGRLAINFFARAPALRSGGILVGLSVENRQGTVINPSRTAVGRERRNSFRRGQEDGGFLGGALGWEEDRVRIEIFPVGSKRASFTSDNVVSF